MTGFRRLAYICIHSSYRYKNVKFSHKIKTYDPSGAQRKRRLQTNDVTTYLEEGKWRNANGQFDVGQGPELLTVERTGRAKGALFAIETEVGVDGCCRSPRALVEIELELVEHAFPILLQQIRVRLYVAWTTKQQRELI